MRRLNLWVVEGMARAIEAQGLRFDAPNDDGVR